MDTDAHWKRFGEVDPYFGVLAHPRFSREQLNDANKAEFFASGERDIEFTFSVIREKLEPGFSPRRALDFGCGVGRLLPVLAARSETVVGYDISPGMLAEARGNCQQENIHLASSIEGTFDFIHSILVFQHIAPRRGEKILAELLTHLNGIGAIQFIYNSRHSALVKLARLARRIMPFPLNGLRNLVQGKPFSYPRMVMYQYNLNRLLNVIRDSGCSDIHLIPLDHGEFDGCMFFFRR